MMRDLQECQAEVFRRSEKRIKERKKRRNHVLMLCIPLVLCLTTIGGFLLSGYGLTKSTDEAIPVCAETAPYTIIAKASGALVDSVEVSGNGLSHLYTAAEDVRAIIDFIDKVVRTPQTNTMSETILETQDISTTLRDDPEMVGYKILVKHSDGSSAEYLLTSSSLTNQATQEIFHMSEDAYFALKDLLGIPFN